MRLERRIISGARVMFDPRSTAEAYANRDMTNHAKRKPKNWKQLEDKIKRAAPDRR